LAARAFSDAQIVGVVKRALAGSQRNIHADMKRGLGGLATIASTAPFVGLFGTVTGIMNALYRGCGAPRAVCMAAAANGVSEALVSTALGLLVAVPAAWAFNYFTSRLEIFHIEAVNSAMELESYLVLQLVRRGRVW
jgi:biopolymer transport protein ExbB/TolQ